MTIPLKATPLSGEAFAAYGEVIEATGEPDKIINMGMCGRFHDRARLDFADGRAGISLFRAEARHLPLRIDMVERHPEGSQTFIPITGTPYLVVVADDLDGVPGNIKAFVAGPEQVINLHRGTWHGVLTPLGGPGDYIVVDRIGAGANLQEHWFETPFLVETLG